MTTWKKEIERVMSTTGDTWDSIEAMEWGDFKNLKPGEKWFETEFDDGFGSVEGCSFTVWTKDYVYFPVNYDGAESADYVPRNPNRQAKEHVGGD